MSKATLDPEQIAAALTLIKRLPMYHIDASITGIGQLLPRVSSEVLTRVDPNFIIVLDTVEKKPFIGSNFNYFEGAFRSPWSGNYFPVSPAKVPLVPGSIASIESKCHAMLNKHREAHYGGGVASAIAWDLTTSDNEMFASYAIALNILKEISPSTDGSFRSGRWQISHVVDVKEASAQNARTWNSSSTAARTLALKMVSSITFVMDLKQTRQAAELWNGASDQNDLQPIRPNKSCINGRVGKTVEQQTSVHLNAGNAPMNAVPGGIAPLVEAFSVDGEDQIVNAVFSMLRESENAFQQWMKQHVRKCSSVIMSGISAIKTDNQAQNHLQKYDVVPSQMLSHALSEKKNKSQSVNFRENSVKKKVGFAAEGDSDNEMTLDE
eukprot:GDKJ01030194.1.p1 GENE.GDKJ01030194.1~~GDKJ01030194.1.p1  ORF type:complete len:389 (-),score=63.70 GDKJ01030194.1:36-1178(-)